MTARLFAFSLGLFRLLGPLVSLLPPLSPSPCLPHFVLPDVAGASADAESSPGALHRLQELRLITLPGAPQLA